MATNTPLNSLFTIPPLATPLTVAGDSLGVPFEGRGSPPATQVSVQWAAFFSALGTLLNPIWKPRCDSSGVILSGEVPFPALQNGWTVSQPGTYGLSAWTVIGRDLCFRGRITGGTITNATLLWTMPSQVFPAFTSSCVVTSATAGFAAFGTATLYYLQNGQVQLFGAPVGTTFVDIYSRFALF